MLHFYCPPPSQGIHSSSPILNHLLKASQYSSGPALPVPDLNDLYLEGREGLYLLQARGGRRVRKRKDTEISQVTVPTGLSVFLALPTYSSSWVAVEPVSGWAQQPQPATGLGSPPAEALSDQKSPSLLPVAWCQS